jgi:hypothetical protein
MYITRMINKDFVGPKNVHMTMFYTFLHLGFIKGNKKLKSIIRCNKIR